MSCVGLRGFYVCGCVWMCEELYSKNIMTGTPDTSSILTHLFHSVSVWDWCALVKESNGILEPDLSFLFGFWIDS